jgi:hypothetical protein
MNFVLLPKSASSPLYVFGVSEKTVHPHHGRHLLISSSRNVLKDQPYVTYVVETPVAITYIYPGSPLLLQHPQTRPFL